jgi:hypothetical protein
MHEVGRDTYVALYLEGLFEGDSGLLFWSFVTLQPRYR